jgi:hypothetical protein
MSAPLHTRRLARLCCGLMSPQDKKGYVATEPISSEPRQETASRVWEPQATFRSENMPQ